MKVNLLLTKHSAKGIHAALLCEIFMPENKKTCPDCNGSGEQDWRLYRSGGDQFPIPPCKTCKGTGQIVDNETSEQKETK